MYKKNIYGKLFYTYGFVLLYFHLMKHNSLTKCDK